MADQDDTAANEAKALDLKNQGNDQLKIGHYLQAIGFYSEALEFSPTNAIILSNRAQAYPLHGLAALVGPWHASRGRQPPRGVLFSLAPCAT